MNENARFLRAAERNLAAPRSGARPLNGSDDRCRRRGDRGFHPPQESQSGPGRPWLSGRGISWPRSSENILDPSSRRISG
jgi:hypothetical protein